MNALIATWLLSTLFLSTAINAESPPQTATGIVLSSPWMTTIYQYAREHSVHPSWGLAHSERNYHNAKALARTEDTTLDDEVLFAAAFLHDLGGLAAVAKKDVDHAVRSVELAEPLLARRVPHAEMARGQR